MGLGITGQQARSSQGPGPRQVHPRPHHFQCPERIAKAPPGFVPLPSLGLGSSLAPAPQARGGTARQPDAVAPSPVLVDFSRPSCFSPRVRVVAREPTARCPQLPAPSDARTHSCTHPPPPAPAPDLAIQSGRSQGKCSVTPRPRQILLARSHANHAERE